MTSLNIKQKNKRVHKYSDKINQKMTWKNLKMINKYLNNFPEHHNKINTTNKTLNHINTNSN